MRAICALSLISLICIVGLVTCASPPSPVQQHQAGEVSRAAAEFAYKAIYSAYQQGSLSRQDMDQGDALYDRWRQAQKAWVDAVRLRSQDLAVVRQTLLTALLDLLTFAADHQRL